MPGSARIATLTTVPLHDRSAGFPADSSDRLASIPVEVIQHSPFRARVDTDEEHLASLAQSIDDHELTSPILVRPLAGDQYEVVCGEVRLEAHRILGRSHVTAIVRSMSDESAAKLIAADNMQRRDLSDWEVCRFISALFAHGFVRTDSEVASLIGRRRGYVTKVRAFNDLPPAAAQIVATAHHQFGANLAADLRATGYLESQPKLVADALKRVLTGGLTQAGVIPWLRNKIAGDCSTNVSDATIRINNKMVRITVYQDTIRISCPGMDTVSVEAVLRESLHQVL